MSKHNKVNKDRYTQRGRLTPDEAAREQAKQRQATAPDDRANGGPVTRKDKPRDEETDEE
jgi:hypothetical protein